MDNERFKLITRRVIAWAVVGVALVGFGFLVIYGAIQGNEILVALGAGTLSSTLGAAIAFFFGKKASEE